MILNCIIINNDTKIIDLLKSYVEQTSFLRLIGVYSSAIAAIKDIRENKIDLVYLAAEMSEISGIEFAKILTKETKIVFIADDGRYAVQGYKVNTVDYLINPVKYDDFVEASKRVVESMSSDKLTQEANRFIFVKSDYKLVQIVLDDILFIEGEKDYVNFHLESGKEITSLINMKKIEKYLPRPEFLRVHRSFIVHMTKTRLVDRFRIVFDETFIPISESYRADVENFFDSNTIA